MESNNTTAQYSPLNNLSSGEEIEQFSLPVSVNVNKPKRRRKRKEFDSLKAQSIVAHKAGGVCRLSTCIVTLTFILLVAGICSLSVLTYQLYMQVNELQKEFSALKNVDESRTASLGFLMSRLEDEQSVMITVKANIQTINQTVESVRSGLNDANSRLTSLNKEQSEKVKSTDLEPLKKLEERLAEFGSDISSMQTDMATLQQKELSTEARLDDFDSKLTTTLEITAEPVDQGNTGDQFTDLLQKVQTINKTLSARVDSMNGPIQRAYTNYTTLNSRLSALDSDVTGYIEQLNQELWMVNLTAQQAMSDISEMGERNAVNGNAVSMVSGDIHGDRVDKLAERVDSLESSIREVYLRQQDRMATLTENQVVNLTIARGMEDIISRVINQQLETIHDRVDNVSHHSASLDARLTQLDDKFIILSQQIGGLVKLIEAGVADNDTYSISVTSNDSTTDKPAAVTEITESDMTGSVDIQGTNSQSPVIVTQNSDILANSSSTVTDTGLQTTPSLQDLLDSPR